MISNLRSINSLRYILQSASGGESRTILCKNNMWHISLLNDETASICCFFSYDVGIFNL